MGAIYKPKRSQPYLDGARHTFIKVRISEKEKMSVMQFVVWRDAVTAGQWQIYTTVRDITT